MHVTGTPESLLHLLEIRPLGVDDLSTARYVVSASFNRAATEYYSGTELAAFAAFVRSPQYADLLLGNRSYAAWVGSEMVAVAAWAPGDDKSPTARIPAVYVHPMFAGQGIGTRLTEYLADEAAAAGYRALEASVTLNATMFFERLHFVEVRPAGWKLPSGSELPIAVMRRSATGRADIMH